MLYASAFTNANSNNTNINALERWNKSLPPQRSNGTDQRRENKMNSFQDLITLAGSFPTNSPMSEEAWKMLHDGKYPFLLLLCFHSQHTQTKD